MMRATPIGNIMVLLLGFLNVQNFPSIQHFKIYFQAIYIYIDMKIHENMVIIMFNSNFNIKTNILIQFSI